MSKVHKKERVILPKTKALAVRKKITAINKNTIEAFLSVAAFKKEIARLEKSIKKDLDSMSEMGEMESLRLQMAMDRMSKMMETLSNVLKKISDTANNITQNLK